MKYLKKNPRIPLALIGASLLVLVVMLGVRTKVRAQETAPTWGSSDIGNVPSAGVVQTPAADSFIVTSSGRDIFRGQDSFHYVYQPLGPNGQITAYVSWLGATNGHAKAALMVRENLSASSRAATLALRFQEGVEFLWRGNIQNTEFIANTNAVGPMWLRLIRNGDWVGGYTSADGANWTLLGWWTFPGLADQAYIGLATTSNDGGPATAEYDSVSVGAADPALVLSPIEGGGDGLHAWYFDNRHLSGLPVTNRIEKGEIYIDFAAWTAHERGTLAERRRSVLGIPRVVEFGVRWTGEIQAQFTEPYTISVASDDGARVWLDEQLIIDNWTVHPSQRASSAPINMMAGERHLLRVEYFENGGPADIELKWSSPSTPVTLVPQTQLYSQLTDVDGNGLPDRWEQHYFGQVGVDPNADPDGDGLSNLQEYKRWSDPTDPKKAGVPNDWSHGDIDNYGESHGDASESNGLFTVKSYGYDTWDHQDSFHYVYQTLGTNNQIIAHVVGLSATNQYAKAGIMIRETLEGRSRDAIMTLQEGANPQYLERDNWWDRTRATDVGTNLNAAQWLKLVRYGRWIGGFVSPDGTNWTQVDWRMMDHAPEKVYAGLISVAHNKPGNSGICVAEFDNVSIGAADLSQIVLPVLGTGDGLNGSYGNRSLMYLPGLTNRLDSVVAFNWVHDPPFKTLNPDGYGVCWSGEVQAQFTEPYTFSLQCRREDWVRVWVNEKLIIDRWRTLHRDTTLRGTINLVAGKHYLIRVEMYNNLGRGMANLAWSSPSTTTRIVPQSQLYSQPVDSDGNGLPDLWEQLYFGHIGVDPNADPDGDGLSNLQEYQDHSDPAKGDTDGDEMPDGWEISHRLDPQFADASLDYNNTGFSNLQDYLYGLDPYNIDLNGDGLPDSFEVAYLGGDTSTSHADRISIAATVNGADATNYLGNWQVDGADIYALDRRGGLDYVLPVANADKYVLNLVGTQNQVNQFENKFKLLLGVDGQTLGHYTLVAGYGTNGTVEVVLPYLQAGSHTLHVFWDGYASYSSLRIKQLKLLAVSGSATNQYGLKDWALSLIHTESGLDGTNGIISSYTSPVCLEGRDRYPQLATITNNQTNGLTQQWTTDNRWYVNAPLLATTSVVFQATYQSGALTETRLLQWKQVNLLTVTNGFTIRKGDSLLFTAQPPNGTNGNIQITIGTNVLTGKAAKGVAYKFTSPGVYSVTGTYTPASGISQSGNVTVDVVQQNLPNVQPAAWTWMERNLNLATVAPEATLQADSRLECYVAGTNANGAVQLTLGLQDNENRSILARLGTNGPVLDSVQVIGFDLWSGNQAYTKVVQVYPDQSQLVETMVVVSAVNTNTIFVMQPIVSGVMFEDGTTLKTLTATNFDALGQCPVRFIRPAAARTSVCNSIKAYQGNYQIGYRH